MEADKKIKANKIKLANKEKVKAMDSNKTINK